MKISFWNVLMLTPLLFGGCSFLELNPVEMQVDGDSFEDVRSGADGQSLYYYYYDERLPLTLDADRAFLKFDDVSEKQGFLSNLHTGVSALAVDDSHVGSGSGIIVLSAPQNGLSLRQLYDRCEDYGATVVSYMFDYEGQEIAISDAFSVKLAEGTTYEALRDLADRYGCQVSRTEKFGEGVFLVKVLETSGYGALQISNLFYESGLFEFASPEFYVFGAECSQDPKFIEQWNLKNIGQYSGYARFDINMEPAWEITQGSDDVVVAVVDQGVDLTHPDLAQNIVAGYDIVSGTSGGGVVSSGDTHGTPVAGIIAAVKDNGIGISGVAPDCKIMPIRVSDGVSINSWDAADAINWAWTHGADVINGSWGLGVKSSLLTSELQRAAKEGRDGKGCVLVFSSGNTIGGDHQGVVFPASLHCVMAVGAISYDGKRRNLSSPDYSYNNWSSNYGAGLNVVAPGVCVPATSNYGNYVDFAGTSAAAPQVSGVAALILSKYPDLPQDLVRRSIERGCRELTGYTYHDDSGYPASSLNEEVGYGLLDAEGAISRAGLLNRQVMLDKTPGFDFTIVNNTSYHLDDVILDVWGTFDGQEERVISSDILNGVGSMQQEGYPVYRGYELDEKYAGATTDIYVQFSAVCPDASEQVEIGVYVDNGVEQYDRFSLDSYEPYEKTINNVSIYDGRRRRIYVKLYDLPNL